MQASGYTEEGHFHHYIIVGLLESDCIHVTLEKSVSNHYIVDTEYHPTCMQQEPLYKAKTSQ